MWSFPCRQVNFGHFGNARSNHRGALNMSDWLQAIHLFRISLSQYLPQKKIPRSWPQKITRVDVDSRWRWLKTAEPSIGTFTLGARNCRMTMMFLRKRHCGLSTVPCGDVVESMHSFPVGFSKSFDQVPSSAFRNNSMPFESGGPSTWHQSLTCAVAAIHPAWLFDQEVWEWWFGDESETGSFLCFGPGRLPRKRRRLGNWTRWFWVFSLKCSAQTWIRGLDNEVSTPEW